MSIGICILVRSCHREDWTRADNYSGSKIGAALHFERSNAETAPYRSPGKRHQDYIIHWPEAV